MKDFVPEEITQLIRKIEAKRDSAYHAAKRAEDAEAARLGRIEALRETRRSELVATAPADV